MNEFYLQSLLNELSTIKKRVGRLALLIYIIPVIYILLEGNETINFSIGFFSLKGSESILVFIPIMYIGIYYSMFHLGEKSLDVYSMITALSPKNELKNEWLKTIEPSLATTNLIRGLSKTGLSRFFFFYPALILLVVMPFTFLVYSMINTIKLAVLEINILYIIASILALWFCGAIFYFVYKSPSLKDSVERRKQLIDKFQKTDSIQK